MRSPIPQSFLKPLLIFVILLLGINALSLTKKIVETVNFNCTISNYSCYENYYTDLVKKQGIKNAFDDLRMRYQKDSFVKSVCHPLVHVLGRTATEKLKTPSEAFKEGDNFCSSGYYHGVLEGIASKLGRQNLLAKLDSICTDIKGKNVHSIDYYNCVHGLGHGLMAITDDELFESLNYCDRLTGRWEQLSCGGGVFMENIIADGITGHKTKYLKANDLLYPCNETPEKYIGSCYLMQSSYILKTNGFNFEKTFETCSRAEGIYKNSCYASLGRDVSGFTISDTQATARICLLGKNQEQKLGCLQGAARDFVYYFSSDKRAKELCNSLEDPYLKKGCLESTVQFYSQSFKPVSK